LRRCPLVSYMPTPSPTPISPLSLHDALPIFAGAVAAAARRPGRRAVADRAPRAERREARARRAGHADAEPRAAPRDARGAVRRADRKSTRLNSSHQIISYAVFCLKKKKKKQT